MAIIKCFNCKNEVSDIVSYSCRKCGYSVARSKENWKKLENAPPAAPIEHFEYDIEADRDALYETIIPAILDESNHYNVKINVRKLFYKFDSICKGASDSLTKNIFKFVEEKEKVYDYSVKKNAEQAEFALRTYKKQMENIETPGLGFDIITNDAASAIAYTALNKYEVTKQYLKQSNAAANQLIANLPFLTSNSMLQSDIFKYKYQIDQSLLLAKKLVDTNNYLAAHPDFYSDSERYNNGLEFDGHAVYDILKSISEPVKTISGAPKKVMGKPEVTNEIINILLNENYLYQIGDYFCSTTKYEKKVIRDIYWKEHPEEKLKAEAEEEKKNQEAYKKAEDLYANEKYYEAAVAFNAISGYKDSALRSIQIWREFVLERDSIAIRFSRVVGLREDGTVYVSGKTGKRNISDATMYEKIRQWRDIIAISNIDLPCGMDIEGNIHFLVAGSLGTTVEQAFGNKKTPDVHCLDCSEGKTYARLQDNGAVLVTGAKASEYAFLTKWEPVTKLIPTGPLYSYMYGVIQPSIIGLTKDGRVLCESKSDVIKRELSQWTNIVDLIYEQGLVGLRADGTVVTFNYNYNLSDWKNVIGLFTSSSCIIGICADGTVLSAGECNHEEIYKWKLFDNVNTRTQYMQLKKKQLLDSYKEELENCRRELANTRGIFAGSKKKKLEKRIMELEAKIQ